MIKVNLDFLNSPKVVKESFLRKCYNKLMMCLIDYGVIYILYAICAVGYLISPSSLLLIINLCIMGTMWFCIHKSMKQEIAMTEKRIMNQVYKLTNKKVVKK